MQHYRNFSKYINGFNKKLEQVRVDEISPEPYCRKYLSHILAHREYYLNIYADVLEKLSMNNPKPFADTVLVDFGCGNGLLGLFAGFCGCRQVMLVDMDEKFIRASQRLADKLQITPVAYITGDIGALQSASLAIIPDAVIGTDVIEHIYSLDDFFMTLKKINPRMATVFTTASNPANYLKVRSIEKIQVRDELQGGDPDDHVLFGESALAPFIKMREEIISRHDTFLTREEVQKLSTATRGLIKDDITRAVDLYRQTGTLPKPPERYNTCNPQNGSWTERIMPLHAYRAVFAAAGFSCRIYPGFFNAFEKGPGAFVKKMLNVAIRFLGIRISPYIVIAGVDPGNATC